MSLPPKSDLPLEKKRRNLALLIGLLCFVAIIYGVTIIKMNIFGKP